MTIRNNDEIERAWLLLKVPETGFGQLRHLSADIFTDIETAYPGDVMEMVVRADITEGDYDLVVPISATDDARLDAITDLVRDLVESYSSAGTVERAVVRYYNPAPATLAASYVTDSEAYNPPKGKNRQGTGFNAWG